MDERGSGNVCALQANYKSHIRIPPNFQCGFFDSGDVAYHLIDIHVDEWISGQ